MQEKDMVLDVLNGSKACCTSYTIAMTECANLNLKEKFSTMRSLSEKFQYELYVIAKNKNYYEESFPATEEEIKKVKALLIKSSTTQQGAGPIPNSK